MPIKDRKELFVQLLSNVRQGTERSVQFYEEISKAGLNPDVKEAMSARAYVMNKTLDTLDECFKLVGAKPMKVNSRLVEVFVEDFRRELAEIQSTEAKHIYIMSKVSHLVSLGIGEFVALVAAADATGNHALGVLLESCLADKLAFAERTRRAIRRVIEGKIAEKIAA